MRNLFLKLADKLNDKAHDTIVAEVKAGIYSARFGTRGEWLYWLAFKAYSVVIFCDWLNGSK